MDQKQLDQIVNDLAQTGINLTYMLRYACLSPTQKATLQYRLKHEEEVLRVMTVLPGKHRYEQVEAAIEASGVAPRDIYESLAANNHTFALARFYEALNGPGSTQE